MNELQTYSKKSDTDNSGFDHLLNAIISTFLLAAVAAGLFRWSITDVLSQIIVFTVAGIASWTDIRDRVIPNTLILFGLTVAIFLNISGQLTWAESLISGTGAFISVLLVRWLGSQLYDKPGFGMGDAKLFLVLGMLIGLEIFWILYVSVMMAGIFAISGMALGYLRRESSLAFAPFIALAVLLDFYWISWNQIWRWLVW